MSEFAAALKLSREKGVGAATFRSLIEEYILPSIAQKAWKEKLQQNLALSKVSLGKSRTSEQIKLTLEMLQAEAFSGWYYSQTGYPEKLKDLGEPPPVIFATGPLKNTRFAAIVGAREMSNEAAYFARIVTEYFISKGYAIVSGGAAGVDAVAHETALAVGAYTVAVLGTGLDIVYPPCNKELFAKIRTNGTLLTELMPGARPARSFFPTRNRIIAALAEVVVVVQASEKSGSMITASWATRLGRQLITIAPPPGATGVWAGNRALIDAGAEIFSVTATRAT